MSKSARWRSSMGLRVPYAWEAIQRTRTGPLAYGTAQSVWGVSIPLNASSRQMLSPCSTILFAARALSP